MRLNEILNEEQINELDWKDVAKGAGKAVGATAKGVAGAGKAAGSAGKSFTSGFKSGYQQGGLGRMAVNAVGDKIDKWANKGSEPSDQTSPAANQTRPSGITYKQPTPGSATDYEEIKQAAANLPKAEKDALIKDLSEPQQAAEPEKPPVNYDTPTAQRQGKTIPQDAPAAAPQGTVAQVGKKASQPGQRQSGDMIKVGDNSLQWTGEPGKEWFVAGGTLSKPNPQTDKMNRIQQVGGKRYISADDAKKLLQAEGRIRSNYLGIDL